MNLGRRSLKNRALRIIRTALLIGFFGGWVADSIAGNCFSKMASNPSDYNMDEGEYSSESDSDIRQDASVGDRTGLDRDESSETSLVPSQIPTSASDVVPDQTYDTVRLNEKVDVDTGSSDDRQGSVGDGNEIQASDDESFSAPPQDTRDMPSYRRAQLLDEALDVPCRELLGFCANYANVGNHLNSSFDLEAFVWFLTDCLSASPQPKVRINGEEFSIVDAMSMDSTNAMRKLASSMGRALEEEDVSSLAMEELASYLFLMNDFLAALPSKFYCLKNRIRPEDKKANLVINYLVYGDYLDKCSAEYIMRHISSIGSLDQEISMKDFTISLARLICDHIPPDLRTLKEEIKKCFGNCCSSFAISSRDEVDDWVNGLIGNDKIVFIKDWWDVSRAELEKARNFLISVLDWGCDDGCLLNQVLKEVQECIRPYLLLFIGNCCPFEEYPISFPGMDDISEEDHSVLGVDVSEGRPPASDMDMKKDSRSVPYMDTRKDSSYASSKEVSKAPTFLDMKISKVKAYIEKANLDEILEQQDKRRINSERMFKRSNHRPVSVGAPEDSIDDFIAKEQAGNFWPLPESRIVAKPYLPWIKRTIVEQLSSEDPDAQIVDLLSDKWFLVPYIALLLHHFPAYTEDSCTVRRSVRAVIDECNAPESETGASV